MFPDNDDDFEDVGIKQVTAEGGDGWSIERDDGWSFWVQKDSPIVPAPGMAARFYGKGVGFEVRGLFLNGQKVFYRTPTEQDQKNRRQAEERKKEREYDFEKNRGDLDRRFAMLPSVFQDRIAKYRRANPTFRVEFEPYELFACEQAVVIAEAMRAEGLCLIIPSCPKIIEPASRSVAPIAV